MTQTKSQEDKNIKYLETRYMYEKRTNVYVANEETNQVWDETDIPDFIKAWENNWSLSDIADYFGCSKSELELLVIDLIEQERIQGMVHVSNVDYDVTRQPSLIVKGRLIRVTKDKEIWICARDLCDILKGPRVYQSILEVCSPLERAKHEVDTEIGPQSYIFINMRGLNKLYDHVKNYAHPILNQVKEGMQDRMEPGRKAKPQSTRKKAKGAGGVPAESQKTDN